MINFIPLTYYELIYNILIGFVVFIVCVYSYINPDHIRKVDPNINLLVSLLFLIVWMLLGFRPISYYFGDMGNYNLVFNRVLNGYKSGYQSSDILFDWIIEFCASYLNAKAFFFICFSIYIIPFYIALKRFFGTSWVLVFMMIISISSFYAYGVNGIRNGMATSVVLLGISFKGPVRWFFFLAAVNIHSSAALPVVASLLFVKFKNINYYVYGWLFCLIITIALPGFGEILSNSGLLDDRLASYYSIDMAQPGTGVSGFRIDFLIFGLLPIVVGLFYRLKLNFIDPVYDEILAIYLTANAFWLIVIRIPFSNRIAYLSWFLYGLVIAYPMIKSRLLYNSNRYFSLILSALYISSMTFL